MHVCVDVCMDACMHGCMHALALYLLPALDAHFVELDIRVVQLLPDILSRQCV